MSARLSVARWYAVAGHAGPYLYVGQARFDDGHGEADHDWLAMAPAGGGEEVWVAPGDVSDWSAPVVPLRVTA